MREESTETSETVGLSVNIPGAFEADFVVPHDMQSRNSPKSEPKQA
jgi:hypothetical protein